MSVKSIVNKKNITGITISFLFSYAITIGYLCENNLYSAVSAGNVIVFLSVWLISCILFILSWKALGEYGKKKGGEKENGKGFFIVPISFVVILLGYIPYFLIMFPGLFTYDASPEFVQIWYDEVPVNAMFSIVHSLLLKASCEAGMKFFGEFNPGIALFTGIHMILCSMVFSYESYLVWKITKSKIITVISIVYLTLNPAIALFSVCPHSTVFGSALAAGLLLQFYDLFILKNKGKRSLYILRLCAFAATALLTCNARKSYTALIGILFVIQLFTGKKIIQRTVYFACVLVLAFAFNAGLENIYKAQKNSGTELMSVPVQELANVYVKSGGNLFDANEKEILLNYYAEEHFKWYCPWCTDMIKIGLNQDAFNSNPVPFYKLWIKKGIQHPFLYLEAWNYLTYEAWYPFCEPDGYVHQNMVFMGSKGEFENDYMRIIHEAPAEHVNNFPKLFEKIKEFGTASKIHKIPIVGQIATIGYQYLFLLYVIGFNIYNKKKGTGLLVAAVLAYFVVSLFAPIVLLRYHLLLFYMFPITLSSLFEKNYNIKERSA